MPTRFLGELPRVPLTSSLLQFLCLQGRAITFDLTECSKEKDRTFLHTCYLALSKVLFLGSFALAPGIGDG